MTTTLLGIRQNDNNWENCDSDDMDRYLSKNTKQRNMFC